MQKKLPGKFSMAIRSTIFVVTVAIFTMFWSLVCVASYPFPLRIRFPIVMVWTNSVVWLLKHICCIDYRVEGLENIPKDRNGIILSKHSSAWETFFLPDHFHQTAIILKHELYWVPFFGWGMVATSPIGINRSAKTSAMTQIIEKGKKFLAEGRWILVFPEGTRIPYGKHAKYKLGGTRLAVASGYPVLPVAHNAGKFWGKRHFIKTPGTITIVFGPLMESKDITAEALMAKVENWIETTIESIDGVKAVPL